MAESIGKVLFVGNPERKTEVDKAKKYLIVRRDKVRRALVWLCANHKEFIAQKITVNEEVINTLPTNGVPQVILDRWINSTEEEANAAESSGYVPEYPQCGPLADLISKTKMTAAPDNLDDETSTSSNHGPCS